MVWETNVKRIQHDLEMMARHTATPGAGVTRFSFTEQDRLTREYIKSRMRECNLTVYEDAAGAVIGRREGAKGDAPVVMVGSHFDSVKNGGAFDGPAGVVAALEIAGILNENQVKTEYPIEFVALIEEEGGRFGGGLFGSRAMAGRVTQEELTEFKDAQGISMAEAMAAFGFDPAKIGEAARKPEQLRAFLELHIEQGPILETTGIDAGIVETVVGLTQLEITLTGRPDHAGTTPMAMRADALVAAADIIRLVNRLAQEAGEGTVATVGRLAVSPGAANIVPGNVVFTVDIRSAGAATIGQIREAVEQAVNR
ncbi:MAG: Zn-dependent hydrolase, partial [Negativicutes bacterium]|nr:Zn-dependent hydrolase [Negativicutes bacterium]